MYAAILWLDFSYNHFWPGTKLYGPHCQRSKCAPEEEMMHKKYKKTGKIYNQPELS